MAGPHRRCLDCRLAYLQTWRRRHPGASQHDWKNAVRTFTLECKYEGLLVSEPCRDCGFGGLGAIKIQMHHLDYNRPLDIVWLCHACHTARHNTESLALRNRARTGRGTSYLQEATAWSPSFWMK